MLLDPAVDQLQPCGDQSVTELINHSACYSISIDGIMIGKFNAKGLYGLLIICVSIYIYILPLLSLSLPLHSDKES